MHGSVFPEICNAHATSETLWALAHRPPTSGGRQRRSGVRYIFMHLCCHRRQIGVFAFFTQTLNEMDRNVFSVNVLIEIENKDFQ